MFESQAKAIRKKKELQKLADLLGQKFSLDPKQLLEIAECVTKLYNSSAVYVREPPVTEIIWNTGRPYSDEGQIIHARTKDGFVPDPVLNVEPFDVEFSDKTRGVSGIVKVFSFGKAQILSAYDAGGYKYCSDFTLEEPTDEKI